MFSLRELWAAVQALDNRVPADAQVAVYLGARRLLDRLVRWLLQNRRAPLDVEAEIARLRPGVSRSVRVRFTIAALLATYGNGCRPGRRPTTLARLTTAAGADRRNSGTQTVSVLAIAAVLDMLGLDACCSGVATATASAILTAPLGRMGWSPIVWRASRKDVDDLPDHVDRMDRVLVSLTATLEERSDEAGSIQFMIVDGRRRFPVQTTPLGEGRYRLEINVTNFRKRSPVPNGAWRFVPYLNGQPGPAAGYDLSSLEKLDEGPRTFLYASLYASNTASYIVNFGISEDDEDRSFLMRDVPDVAKPQVETEGTQASAEAAHRASAAPTRASGKARKPRVSARTPAQPAARQSHSVRVGDAYHHAGQPGSRP